MSKLTDHDRREIHRLSNAGFSDLYLSNRYGVSARTIVQIRRGQWTTGSLNKPSRISGLRSAV